MKLMTKTKDAPFHTVLIERPSALDPKQCEELTKRLVELSRRATAGVNWREYAPGEHGWIAYYAAPGNRVQDYDRIVFVEDQERILHALCVQTLTLNDYRVIWIHIALTDMSHHDSGLLATAAQSMFSREWLSTLKPPCVAVFRTPNPIAYEAVRTLASRLTPGSRVFPEIDASGQLVPVPDGIRDLVTKLSAELSPRCAFNSETFVLKGYFKDFGALYSDFNFPCRNPAVASYFDRYLDRSNMDGLLAVVQLT